MNLYKRISYPLIYRLYSDLAFFCAGSLGCLPGSSAKDRFCPWHQMIFITQGSLLLHMNSSTLQLSAGDVCFIPQGTAYRWQKEADSPFCCSWVGFLGLRSQYYLSLIAAYADGGCCLRGLNIKKYKTTVNQILALEGKPATQYLQAAGLLHALLSQLLKDLLFSQVPWSPQNAAFQVKFYLDLNYSQQFLLKDLAFSLGIHPGYLTQLFSETFGCTPKRYLLQLKLQKACCLLKSTDMPILLVAAFVGFQDQMAFSRFFKKSFLCSPTQYRLKGNHSKS